MVKTTTMLSQLLRASVVSRAASLLAIALTSVACAIAGAGVDGIPTSGDVDAGSAGSSPSGEDAATTHADAATVAPPDDASTGAPDTGTHHAPDAAPHAPDASTSHADSGVGLTCGTMVAPTVVAGCHSCTNQTCQTNGCYGGYWCDTATVKCHAPPTTCP